jgi:hypothetical protein
MIADENYGLFVRTLNAGFALLQPNQFWLTDLSVKMLVW